MSPGPAISVVVPTRHRPMALRACLQSLSGQSLARAEWELIVVEDDDLGVGGELLTRAFPGLPLRYLRQAHRGCGAARNRGAEVARGRYVAFTDDDCLLPPDWLAKMKTSIDRGEGRMIAGRPVNALKNNAYSEATQQLIDYLLAHFNAEPDEAMLAIGCNFAVPRKEFCNLGGFAPEFYRQAAEERNFCYRWIAAGRRIRYEPDLIVHHAHHLNFITFLRQHFHYGRGARVYHRLKSENLGGKTGFEQAGFYGGLLAWPWKRKLGWRAAGLEALFVASQAAQTAGYLRQMLA
jgi:glycosyltransferase involved in cell wall biosynthesis